MTESRCSRIKVRTLSSVVKCLDVQDFTWVAFPLADFRVDHFSSQRTQTRSSAHCSSVRVREYESEVECLEAFAALGFFATPLFDEGSVEDRAVVWAARIAIIVGAVVIERV